MSVKLTDTQLMMLSAASQREDRCIAAGTNAKGAAGQTIAAKLVAAGLAKEIRAKPGVYVWRRDEATGQTYALKLTAAGLKAIAVEDEPAKDTEVENSAAVQAALVSSSEDPQPSTSSVAPVMTAAEPRDGSKLAEVIGMLRSESGATIDQMAAAMSWLPHTTRAALTGLRKRGFVIDRRKASDQRAGAYVIADGANVARG